MHQTRLHSVKAWIQQYDLTSFGEYAVVETNSCSQRDTMIPLLWASTSEHNENLFAKQLSSTQSANSCEYKEIYNANASMYIAAFWGIIFTHSSLAQELSQDHTFYDLGVSPCLPQQRFSDVRVHGMVHHVACMPWCTMLRAFCGAPCCAHAVAHDVACMPWRTMLRACRGAPCCLLGLFLVLP
jgi:hypothetical protein